MIPHLAKGVNEMDELFFAHKRKNVYIKTYAHDYANTAAAAAKSDALCRT